jgi:nitronate monooxygenase
MAATPPALRRNASAIELTRDDSSRTPRERVVAAWLLSMEKSICPVPASSGATLLPPLIQGGMGIGVSNWRLARAVAQAGQLGVVSATALNTILVRRLQRGDPGGEVRAALRQCPLRRAAERIQARYFVPGGIASGQRFRLAPVFTVTPSMDLLELTIVANFVEVFLAKQGHCGVVGVNLLEKVQMPTLPSLLGAMLAGVDCVLMGAGIPRSIPGVLDNLAAWKPVELRVTVDGAAPGEEHVVRLDPAIFFGEDKPVLRRPLFLAIVSSSTLAMTLARKSNGRVDGFVVEGLSAGGHNAPPRGKAAANARGEPVYGPRDHPDYEAIRALGLPFWLAGSSASPAKLREARALGARGVQIGTAFAFCEESGLDETFKRAVLAQSATGKIDLLTDPRASPTGMPFKVIDLPGTVSRDDVYAQRERVCDLAYLRQPYRKSDGELGFRCPAEPVDDYVRKGGEPVETVGRKCLCNGLFSAIGLGQAMGGGEVEPAIVTAGSEVSEVSRFLRPGASSYSAADVLHHVLAAPAEGLQGLPASAEAS